MADPNLLVTSDPGQQQKVEGTIRGILKQAGLEEPAFQESNLAGLTLLRIDGDPAALVSELRQKCRDDPSAFRGTFRWVPIETTADATEETIERVAKEFNGRIADNDTWAIEVNIHESDFHKQQVTELAAKHIDHPNVDLEHPDKQVRFEIIEDRIAASLLSPSQILNVNEFRESSPVEPRE